MSLFTHARRFLSALLCAVLILLSPGIASYEAAARDFSAKSAGAPVNIGVVPARRAVMQPGITPLTPALINARFGEVRHPQAAVAEAAVPTAAAARGSVSAQTAQLSAETTSAVDGLGEISQAPAGQAREGGLTLQNILQGRRADGAALAPAAYGMVFAKPAGRDSIGAPAAALAGRSAASKADVPSQTQPPQPPAPPSGPNGGGNGKGDGGNGFEKAPLIPRVLTSLAVFALPAYFIGLPLLAAGAMLPASLFFIAAGFVAATPFIKDSWPKAIKALPAVSILALGAYTVVHGALAISAGLNPLIMGLVVTLGGYGFLRFALGRSDEAHAASDKVATFFGAVGAVVGSGLVLLAAPGQIAALFMFVSYPATLILFMHLPGWIGNAVTQAARALFYAVQDSYHVATSLRRDTSLQRRLAAYTRASIKHSGWNAIWLGLVVWLPVVIVEGIKTLVGGAVGLFTGILRAPLFAFWGASHKLAPESGFTRFFAGWALKASAFNKTGMFNRVESRYIDAANSDGKPARFIAAAKIAVLQGVWMLMAVLRQVYWFTFGWLSGFDEVRKPYDEARHNPKHYDLKSDPLPAKVPSVPEPTVTTAWPGKTIAFLVGMAPLLLWSGLVAEGPLGWLTLAAVAAVGLMPALPASGLHEQLRKLPGSLMFWTGVFGVIGAVKALMAGLPGMGPIIALSALTVFAGFGFRFMIGSIQDEKTKKYDIDSAPYIGGFAAAVAMMAALAASFTGMEGLVHTGLMIAAFLLSPLLLYHLPSALWRGVWESLAGFPSAMRKVYNVMRFWSRDSDFNKNLNAWYSHWTDRSIWYAPMFIIPWVLTAVAWVVEAALSLVLGAALGLVTALPRFMYGWARRSDYKSRSTKFWAAFNEKFGAALGLDQETSFDPYVKGLLPALKDKTAATSRPTLKAWGALTASRVVQLLWLIRVLLAGVVSPLLAVWAGASAWGASKKTEEPKS